jgi:hypothetical protein
MFFLVSLKNTQNRKLFGLIARARNTDGTQMAQHLRSRHLNLQEHREWPRRIGSN